MQKNAVWLTVLFVLIFVLLAIALWRFLPAGEVSVADLADRALTASSPEEQVKAAAELAARGEPARPHLRKLMTESQNENVRAIAMDALGGLIDYKSIDGLLTAMNDDSVLVRTRAGAAVGRIIGLDRRFNADAPPTERQQLIELIRSDWETLVQAGKFKTLMEEQAKEESRYANQ